MPVCEKSHVVVRFGDECSPVLRKVNENESGKKYIKHNNQNKYLSQLRGRYRYTDTAKLK